MEAASARMATRAQFEGFAPPKSSLQRFIYNACDPISNYEPNLALNLEIVDLINSKKGNAPREAAFTIVQLVNHRNPNVSLLALGLLDNCVKNCGYPFQLQISTKEFLNELVRRFPERPPMRATRVQGKILEAIEEWRGTICQTSKYKDDLGFIRDMHRLLLYKGYMFPEVCAGADSSSDPLLVACPIGAGGSGSKSISDNSFAAFLPTPVVVPKVPAAIWLAAVTFPTFINLYLSMVRWILSLISSSFATASASSDSSSHIFCILGCALCSAPANS